MLIDIPSEEISNFINVLKNESPDSIFIIHFIETCHKWKQRNDELQISLLYTERSMETGVFIGILKSGCRGPLMTFYAFDDHTNDLEEALEYVRVNWKTVIKFEGISKKHESIVEKLITDHSLITENISPVVLFCVPIEEALKIDVQCPDDVVVLPLREQHADEMYKIWLMKKWFTIDALKNSIRYNDEASYGVFCKISGELFTRCVRSHSGVITALQTVEKAKNKGYAKLLLKYIAKKMAEQDILPCSYIDYDNFSSIRAHRSTGFKDMVPLSNYNMVFEEMQL